MIIGSYWIVHHRDFQYIKRFHRRLIWINLLLLMHVAFLPFPTTMLGNYPGEQYSVTFYTVTLAILGLVLALLWWYASHNHRLIDHDPDPKIINRLNQRGLVTPLIFLSSIVIAMFNPVIAMVVGFGGLTLALH